MTLDLSETKPAAIKKVPADVSDHVQYGMLKIQGASASEIAVLVDSPDGKPARLFVDTNGDGDLTNDAVTEWVKGPEFKGKIAGLKPENLAYAGNATVKLGSAEHSYDARIGFWQYDITKMKGQTPEVLKTLRNSLKYFRDYAMTGKLTLENKEHEVLLLDELATGNFKPAGEHPLVRAFIDLNDNTKLDGAEMFDVAKPMKIDGKVYEITDISADGTSFKFGSSSKIAYSPDDVKVGKIAPAFVAVDMEEKSIPFPEHYKGKVVLLDFWATWCGPCMAEVPNVVSAYKKYHESGFEILGVTLDQPDAAEKVKQTTAKHEMTWPQLFGKPGNQAKISEMYSVAAIPSAFLIDGTTEKILAAGNDLRGDGLEKALAKFVHTEAKK